MRSNLSRCCNFLYRFNMSRKVFVSILGMSWYQECHYVKDAFDSGKVRFIQEATLNYLFTKGKWKKEDKIFILLTDMARQNNWTESIEERHHPQMKENMPYERLEKRLKCLDSSCHIEGVTIKEGKNEEELWDIFTTMYNLLEENDELYIDITHSFRYLPMLLLVFCNYVKFLKDVNVAHISYGNFDARVGDKAPIIDLLPIVSLQDWTIAAADYIRHGNVDQIVNLCKKHIEPILKKTEDKNDAIKELNIFADNLKEVIQERQVCRGINIVESVSVKKLKQSCEQISHTIIPPLDPIFEKIKDSLVDYDDNENVMNGFEAAKWCYQNGLYQQCVSILHENLLTYICLLIPDRFKWYERKRRVYIQAALNIVQMPEREWRASEEEKVIIRKLMLDCPEIKEYSHLFQGLNNLRNDFNHAGMREDAKSVHEILNELGKYLNEILIKMGKQSIC